MSRTTKTALAVAITAVIAFLGAYLIDLNGDLSGGDPTTTVTAAPTTTTGLPSSITTTAPPPTTTATTPPVGACPAAARNTAGGPDPWGGCWANADNTGPTTPPTQTLERPANGDRFVVWQQDNRVIENVVINNEVLIQSKNVTFRNSVINGRIDVDCPASIGDCSLTLENVRVNAGDVATAAVGFRSLTIKRSDISGGRLSVACEQNCLIEDSYLHGQVLPPTAPDHLSGFTSFGGNGAGVVVRHSTVWCEPLDNGHDGGCSSSFTLYGDFGPTKNVLAERNLFPVSGAGYCTSWGQNIGKPYGDDVTGVRVIENVVERDARGSCGTYGPDTSFKASEPSNEWRGNTWDDGTPWNHS